MPDKQISHHGVLMNIAGYGVFIIGPAAIGKSSLALELLSQGHQLIADDIVDFSKPNNIVVGHCPPLLENVLHTRELGIMSVPTIFGQQAWQKEHKLDVVISLQATHNSKIELTPEKEYYFVLDSSFPMLKLSTHNPASLTHRIQCWITMIQTPNNAEQILTQRRESSWQ